MRSTRCFAVASITGAVTAFYCWADASSDHRQNRRSATKWLHNGLYGGASLSLPLFVFPFLLPLQFSLSVFLCVCLSVSNSWFLGNLSGFAAVFVLLTAWPPPMQIRQRCGGWQPCEQASSAETQGATVPRAPSEVSLPSCDAADARISGTCINRHYPGKVVVPRFGFEPTLMSRRVHDCRAETGRHNAVAGRVHAVMLSLRTLCPRCGWLGYNRYSAIAHVTMLR